MADMHHLVTVEKADATAAYAALTTQDGITGWWTSRADVPGPKVGDVLKMSFPDAPMTWDMRIDQADEPVRLEWECVGGPPGWETTRVRWSLEQAGADVVVRAQSRGVSCRGRHVPYRDRRLGADAPLAQGVPGNRCPEAVLHVLTRCRGGPWCPSTSRQRL